MSKKPSVNENIVLCKAIKEKNLEQIKIILNRAKSLLEKPLCSSFTPLQYAVFLGCTEIVKYLLKIGASVDNGTQLILERINKENKNRILLELIKAGINVDRQISEDERTILMDAVWEGNFDLVKAIVEAGAYVNAISNDGSYALLNAADRGEQKIFNYLAPYTISELREEAEIALPKGLIYRKRSNDKLTEKFFLATTGDLKGVTKAINNGVNVNAFDSEGFTALYSAAIFHHPAIVNILLKAGANVNLGEESNGQTPLVGSAGDTYLIYPKPNCSVANIKSRQIKVIETLIKADANVNIQTTEGWNALKAAANANNTEVVKLLLSAGANVNVSDKRGDTALSRAKKVGNREIIQLLIEAGAKE